MASISPCSFLCTFRSKNSRTRPSHIQPRISCKASHESDGKPLGGRFDRRDVLIGLGGAAAAGLSTADRKAIAQPIMAPDLSKCGPATGPTNTGIDCCPPYEPTIVDFKPPPPSSALRVRPAAQSVTPEYLAKYTKAVELMKALPADDPRSFTQQANVHCAYCDGAYDQIGFPDLELQVHNSWLFFPWHRFYLYFHERILGKLIGDENFALPFWNWDAPEGMQMPSMYTDVSSSLYDNLRDAKHQPPTVLDLDYNMTDDTSITAAEQVDYNLKVRPDCWNFLNYLTRL